MKTHLKDYAISLRKLGYSYPEILREVPVVKSTLWTWLRNVELPEEAQEKFRARRVRNQQIGIKALHESRVSRVDEIYYAALQDVGDLSLRELWLIGVALYWAEGAKEKDYASGSSVVFFNSDPKMIYLFHQWLLKVVNVEREDLVYDLTIHEASKMRAGELRDFWSEMLGCSKEIVRVHYKRCQNSTTNRRKTGQEYKGMFRIRVRRSSTLTRKLAGWAQGITL